MSITVTLRQNIPIEVSTGTQTLAPAVAPRTVVVNPTVTTVSTTPAVRVVDVTQAPREVVLNGTGQQGPVGPAGPSSDGVAPLSFSYGDAPGVVWTPSQAGTITEARVVFTAAFNGVSPSVIVGTIAAPDSILAADQNDPTAAGEFEATADKHLAANEGVRLAITPGSGATQGAGVLYLMFVPD